MNNPNPARSLALVLSVALASTAPALAETSDGAIQPSPTASVKDKKVCRTVKITGSRLAVRRVCASASSWAELDRQANQSAKELIDSRPPPMPSN